MDYNQVTKKVETRVRSRDMLKDASESKPFQRIIQERNQQEQIVRELIYRIYMATGEEYLWTIREFTYDNVGRIIKECEIQDDTIFGFNEYRRKEKTFTYSDEGKLVEATDIEENKNELFPNRREHIIYEYSDDNLKIGKRYNEQNNLIAIEHYNQYGHLTQEDSYLGVYLFLTKFRKYDLNGNLLEESWRYEDTGHPLSKNYEIGVTFPMWKREYDVTGNEIAYYSYSNQGSKISMEIHSVYNEKGQKISSTSKQIIGENVRECSDSYEYEIIEEVVGAIGATNSNLAKNISSIDELSGSNQAILRQAENGNIAAIIDVAANYRDGVNGFPEDIELAFQWCKKGLEIDVHNAELWVQLARCHEKADTDADKGAAHKAYRCAAELGHVPSMYIIAEDLYYESDENTKAECLPWLEKAVANQDERAEALLGYICLKGEFQTNNRQRGIELLTRSAEHGDSQGARILAEAYLHQIDGSDDIVPYNISKASRYFAIAVDNGEDMPKAMYYAGPAYFYGEGVPKNMEKARKCLEALIDEYVPEEKVFDLLGCMCFEGVGGQVDYILGEKALRRAIGSDDTGISLEAMSNLGMYFYTLTNRLPEAIQLLQRAADEGNANAQVNLGKAYYEGKGVSQNMETAAYYFGLAAEQGNQTAIDNLKVIGTSSNPSNYDSAKKRHPIRGAIIGYLVGGFIGAILHLFWPGAEWISVILGVIIGILKG